MMDDNVVFNLQKKYTEEDLDYLADLILSECQ